MKERVQKLTNTNLIIAVIPSGLELNKPKRGISLCAAFGF
jgi:hypothetical protein